MSRDLESGMVTEATAQALRPFIMVAAYFDSGAVRLWTGYGDLSWNSQTWTGSGALLGISPISETEEIRAEGVNFTLTGIPAEYISLALQEDYQGRLVEVYLGCFDASNAIIADPALLFSGRMDIMEVSEDGSTATINLSAESKLIDLERPRERRYTHEDQQIDFAGDLGLEFVAGLLEKEILWHKSFVGDR